MPAPNGSKSGTAGPGRLSPAAQGVCRNGVPPPSNLSQPSSHPAAHQQGHAVKTRTCCPLACSSHGMSSPVEATAPGLRGGTGSGDSTCRTSSCRVAAPTLVGALRWCLPEPETSRSCLWDLVCLWLSPPAPARHQKQEEADEGVAPVAQLKPGSSVGCWVMTKAHMLITSIS